MKRASHRRHCHRPKYRSQFYRWPTPVAVSSTKRCSKANRSVAFYLAAKCVCVFHKCWIMCSWISVSIKSIVFLMIYAFSARNARPNNWYNSRRPEFCPKMWTHRVWSHAPMPNACAVPYYIVQSIRVPPKMPLHSRWCIVVLANAKAFAHQICIRSRNQHAFDASNAMACFHHRNSFAMYISSKRIVHCIGASIRIIGEPICMWPKTRRIVTSIQSIWTNWMVVIRWPCRICNGTSAIWSERYVCLCIFIFEFDRRNFLATYSSWSFHRREIFIAFFSIRKSNKYNGKTNKNKDENVKSNNCKSIGMDRTEHARARLSLFVGFSKGVCAFTISFRWMCGN